MRNTEPQSICGRNCSIVWIAVVAMGALFVCLLDHRKSSYFASAIGFVAIGAAVVGQALLRRRSLLGDPIYFAIIAYVVFIGVGPFFNAEVSPATPRFMAISWLGIFCLGLGHLVGKSVPTRLRLPSPTASARTQSDNLKELLFAGTFFTVVGTIGVYIYLQSVGGLNYLIQTPYGIRENASIYAAGYALLAPGLILLVAWSLARPRLSLWWSFALLLYTSFDLLWFGPLRGSRRQVYTLVLILVCLIKYSGFRQNKRISFAVQKAFLACALVLILVWGGLRGKSIAELISGAPSDASTMRVTQSATASAIYAPYDTLVRIADSVPELIPYQFGHTFFETATVMIPRSLWPSKPGPLGDWLSATYYGRVNGNSAPSWPGELYLNFGFPGVIVGMLGTGLALAFISRLCPSGCRPVSALDSLLYAVWFALPLDWIWGGSNPAMWYFLAYVFPVYAAVVFIRRHAGRRSVRWVQVGIAPLPMDLQQRRT